jgi:2,3-bisphosphoglycerate-dependent phosphoglycerate mutase
MRFGEQVMSLDGLSREEVLELNIPTGKPLLYEIAKDGAVLQRRYL